MVDPTVVRDVDADHNRDLLVEPPRTCLAFLDADGPQLTPVHYVGDEHAAVIRARSDTALPGVGDEVAVLIDAGRSWFELRAVLLRGRIEGRADAATGEVVSFELDVQRHVAWDYGALRRAGEPITSIPSRPGSTSRWPTDPDGIISASHVARIATTTASGRIAVTPLYFTRHGAYGIWLGTADWTLAARNALRAPSVAVLLGPEGASPAPNVRVRGSAVVRRDRRHVVRYQVGAAVRHMANPQAIADAVTNRRLHALRRRYYAESLQRGRPCVIDVSVTSLDVVDAPGAARPGRPSRDEPTP